MLRILTANIHFSVTFNLCNHLQLYTPGSCELAVFSIPSHTLILWKSDIPEQNWILWEQLKECANKRQTTSHTTSSLVILPIAFVELGWFPHSLRKWRIKERTTTSYQLRFVWITLHRITRKYIYIERERERKRKRERERERGRERERKVVVGDKDCGTYSIPWSSILFLMTHLGMIVFRIDVD